MKRLMLLALLLIPIFTFAQAEKEVETAIQNLKTAMLAEDDATLRTLT